MYHLLNGVLRNVENIGSAYAGSTLTVSENTEKREITAVGVPGKHSRTVKSMLNL